MIDIAGEQLIPISEVPRRLPPRTTGKRVHISAVYRWLQRGVRGVVLESVRVGGSTYTSVEALQRFADQLSSDRHDDLSLSTTTPAWRQKQIEAASREVQDILQNGQPQDRSEATAHRSEDFD